MARFLLVCAGGAFGTGARYLLGGWAQRVLGTAFPYGTLIINALGSFLIVILMHLSIQRGVISPDLRVILTTGVMGGFTTYSTFNYETVRLLQDGALGLGALNILATVVVCLLAGGLGVLICRAIG
ncbi:MAG TPA: fluoride efflux transporter CrcB [Acetobacteraceae bacterium]|jgi:CrcB protein|nr:fluoride efflux transporter CrcB [Acetobacteraceae bacterium]